YTDLDKYNFQFYNFIIGYLLPQRSFLFGFPIALIVLTLVWLGIKRKKKEEFLLAGFTAGIFPLFHFHSFMSVIIIICFLFFLYFEKSINYIKNWLYFFIPMTIIALPQLLFVLVRVTNNDTELFRVHLGWMATDNNYLWFWIKNTGFLIFLVLDTLLSKETSKDLKKLYIPFVFLFFLANIISLSPCWIGDNAKVIFFWFIGSIPLMALSIVRLSKNSKILTSIIVLTLFLSGGIDLTRFMFTSVRSFRLWSTDAINVAKEIRLKTPTHSIFLTAPIHYSPIYLTGRATLMGDHVHVCTQGIDSFFREQKIKSIFANKPRALKIKFIKELNADYALIGPPEKSMLKDKLFFDNNFKKIIQVGEESVYKLK
ncbi:MAG: hypothetical protein H7263_13245, partial [Candidatus Sericytochromatia bacterium]|nr:hypothetical protein [Candidatus Sericytochromatia bacterium]